jgi:hypothetical protein
LRGVPDFKNKRVAKPATEHRPLSQPQTDVIFRQKAGPATGSKEIWKGMNDMDGQNISAVARRRRLSWSKIWEYTRAQQTF